MTSAGLEGDGESREARWARGGPGLGCRQWDVDKGDELSVRLCWGEGCWRAGAHLPRVPLNRGGGGGIAQEADRSARQGSVTHGSPNCLTLNLPVAQSLTILTSGMFPNNPERGVSSVPVYRGRD